MLSSNQITIATMSTKDPDTSTQSKQVQGLDFGSFPQGLINLPSLGQNYNNQYLRNVGDSGVGNNNANTHTNTNSGMSKASTNVSTIDIDEDESSSEYDSESGEDESCEATSGDEITTRKKKKSWKCKNKTVQIGFIKDSFQSHKFNGKKVCKFSKQHFTGD